MHNTRLLKILSHMKEMDIPQIIISDPLSVYYLTGLSVDPMERMLCVHIAPDGTPRLFGNALFGLRPNGIEYHTHTDSDDPLAVLSRFLSPGKIGIDKSWPSRYLISLLALRPDLIPCHGSGPVDTARKIKDADEIVALRRASKINDQVMATAIASVKTGVTEKELANIINRQFYALGADTDSGVQLVCFGKNAADPHHEPDNTVLCPGDCIVFDIFTPIGRYWCDMTRTVFFGAPGEEAKKVYEIVKNANLRGIAAVKPGRPLCDFDRAARGYIEEMGYGEYFTHRTGHGIGLDCHEPPDVSPASQAIAEPGMVFSVEPGIYLEGRLGVRVEDLVLVTETGAEPLTQTSKDFTVIPAE